MSDAIYNQSYYRRNAEKLKARRREEYAKNPAKYIEYSKQYYANNTEKCKLYDAKRHALHGLEKRVRSYGLTLDEYNEMLSQQNQCCAICQAPEAGHRSWHIDHCHITNKVRGLLCHKCNLMLGNARDNTKILGSAIQYLQKESLLVA